MLGSIHDGTGEKLLSGTIDRAFRTALEQSRYVDILPESRVSRALVAKQSAAGGIASEDLAREICRSKGAKMLVDGSINRAAGGYQLGMRLVDCATGRIVRTLRESAASRTQVLSGLIASPASPLEL